MRTGYGKLHSQIWESTLLADGGIVSTGVFALMCAGAGPDGIISMPARGIYNALGLGSPSPGFPGIAFAEFEEVLAFLSAPDPTSQSPDWEGRRIVPLTELPDIESNRGYLIVNHGKYRSDSDAERSKRYRDKKASRAVT